MKKAHIHTFGCQMNEHDSEKIAGILIKEGFEITDDKKQADLIVFNTCSIRQKAEQKFFSELGKLKNAKIRNPDFKIAVAGCIAKQFGSAIKKRAPHVDYIMGPSNIDSLNGFINGSLSSSASVDDNPALLNLRLPVLRKDRHRAWVSIMYGCDNYCSYCIVPYTRGREQSRQSSSIMQEIRELAINRVKEVTLLGQNVNSYKGDIDFAGLLGLINAIGGIERIRFVTSHPRDLSEGLVDAIAVLGKVCEHIHLPMQSGSSDVLKAMNRGYSFKDYINKIDLLRSRVQGIAITTDIIAGFPGETDEDHKQTMSALDSIRFDGVFAFKYSKRPGTPAYEMNGQVPEEIKSNRLSEILALQDTITLELNQMLLDKTVEVLVESANGNTLTGRTMTNKLVHFEGEVSLIGTMQKVKITRPSRHSLMGTISQ